MSIRDKRTQKFTSPAYIIGTVVMFIFMFALPRVMEPWAEGITQAGVATTCVFLGEIIGILATNDLILSAFVAMGGLVVNGILPDSGVISGFMGASYIWQVIMLYALAYVIIRDKTGEVIARFLLTRKFAQRYPLVMIMTLMFVLGLASAFMGVFGCLIVGFALLDGIYAQAGIDQNSKTAKLLYLGCFVTMCIGPQAIGSMAAINLAAGAFFQASVGVEVINLKFVGISFALIIVFCIVYALSMKYVFKCDVGAFSKVDMNSQFGSVSSKLSKKQAIPLIAFLFVALYSFTYTFWPDVPVIKDLKSMGTVIFLTVVLAVLSLIRVDGEQIFNLAEAMAKGPSWPVIMAFASMACIGGQLTSDAHGVKAWLTQVLGGVFSSSNPILFVVVTVLVTLVMTNFFSNTATLLVVSALVATLSGPLVEAGYDITALAVAISLSSMCAYLTYASSGQATILLGHDNMDTKFIWSYGLLTMLIYAVVTIAICSVALFI